MKRSEALIPLSHDHHQALYLTKVLKDSDDSEAATEAFATFWNKHGAAHFRVEEEVLLPGSGLPGPSQDEGVARLLDEHLDIRRRAMKVLAGEASLEDLKELGAVLAGHVRFEERELFPRIESGLDAGQMQVLAGRIAAAEQPG